MGDQPPACPTLLSLLISIREDEANTPCWCEVVTRWEDPKRHAEVLGKHLAVVVQGVATTHAAILGKLCRGW